VHRHGKRQKIGSPEAKASSSLWCEQVEKYDELQAAAQQHQRKVRADAETRARKKSESQGTPVKPVGAL